MPEIHKHCGLLLWPRWSRTLNTNCGLTLESEDSVINVTCKPCFHLDYITEYSASTSCLHQVDLLTCSYDIVWLTIDFYKKDQDHWGRPKNSLIQYVHSSSLSNPGSYVTHNNNNIEWPIKPLSPWPINWKNSLNEVWKSRSMSPCHGPQWCARCSPCHCHSYWDSSRCWKCLTLQTAPEDHRTPTLPQLCDKRGCLLLCCIFVNSSNISHLFFTV